MTAQWNLKYMLFWPNNRKNDGGPELTYYGPILLFIPFDPNIVFPTTYNYRTTLHQKYFSIIIIQQTRGQGLVINASSMEWTWNNNLLLAYANFS